MKTGDCPEDPFTAGYVVELGKGAVHWLPTTDFSMVQKKKKTGMRGKEKLEKVEARQRLRKTDRQTQ